MSMLTQQPTAVQRHLAARALAGRARDAAELAELLEMTGLTAAEGRFPPPDEPEPVASGEPGPTVDAEETRRLARTLLAAYAAAAR
ncbi:hypothetical protein [Prauserella muralis]|uniref:Uncharacterized protein n=1 Tax=Prauserella muralis TaxID=588067 RepID=A0A2V4AIK8_9PSEU|nr:hypothetical protein [Prauserella muralis]PXY19016.1 hypothetical protein BAY60_29810 [Prauserella muralis]TWE28909.1 hypothetical protein FHX69_1577 [Prauserella muralis]